ncbi:transportin MOS14 [Drosophila ananassae]|uniref:transportin MOS14 n=1 Tax=Drosophila ananassae TaxID=7217 RepID=UPI0013A5F1FB|nr:transportin MOS14 [Drosophila ananassae]
MSMSIFYRKRASNPFTKESVTEALKTLVGEGSTRRDRYLRRFQRSPNAWPALDEILADVEAQPMHVLLFAATTIRSKIKREAHTMPVERILQLKSGLTQCLQEAALLPAGRPLIIQLGLCLIDLGLHFASWSYELAELSEKMVSENRPEHIRVFLELLQLLPEEAREYVVNVSPTRENFIERRLWVQAPHVVSLMGQLMGYQSIGLEGEKQCLKVCAAWTRFGYMDAEDLINSRVILRTHLILLHEEEELHAEASDLVVALLESASIANDLELEVFQMGSGLEDKFLGAVAQDKKALVANYVAVFLQLAATTYTVTQGAKTLVAEDRRRRVFGLLLHVARYCEWYPVEQTLNLWRKLLQEPHVAAFEPLVQDLMRILFDRIQLRDSHQDSGLRRSSRFGLFRQRVADILKAMAPQVPPAVMDALLATAQNPASPWMQVEAAVFFLTHFIGSFAHLKTSLYERLLAILSQRPQPVFRRVERRLQKGLKKQATVGGEVNCSSC